MSRTRAVITALLLTSTLTVAGCSDDPKPKFAPPSPTAAATSSAATGETRQEAVVRAFFDGVSASLGTGDSAAFMSMASSDCQNCRVLEANLRSAFTEGGRIQGGRWEVASVEYAGREELGPVWNVEVRTAREQWLDGTGKVIKIVKASRQIFGVALVGRGDAWQVRELRVKEL